MRIRWFALGLVALFFGALGGAILAPQPAGAVNKDMIELEQNVQTILQNQQDLRSAMDQNNASMKTLIQQSIDTVNQMGGQMSSLQKAIEQVQANSGSRMDDLTQKQTGISDNLSDVQGRIQKLATQLGDMQSTLQDIDAKVSAAPPGAQPAPGAQPLPGGNSYPPSSTAPGGPTGDAAPPNYSSPNAYNAPPSYGSPAYAPASNTMAPAAYPPISADTLYRNAQRDYETGNYDLARKEFSDYIKNFPTSDVASDSQFYLGEIYFAQGDYKDAITDYDLVLTKYPQSLKLSSALLKKAQAEVSLKSRTNGIHDLREVISRFPGTDDSRRAKSILQSMGVSATAPRTSTSH